MSSIAIKAQGISKAYQIGEFSTGTISQDIERWIARMRGKEDKFLKVGETNDRTTVGKSNIVWSLKDINFEINQGDAVGIIGRNGAGKSTLLKVLSRVTSPTTGNIKAKGRIASLLEVGTGFHPELTGRENIYLNGAILGMRKKEIQRKFDEIVDFSGVERYVDTPVKRYSSGMYVRLAFAVAAHLESEILIVDEVLAVGDAEFQKKCLGKMGEVSKGEGRTILFVSHNMAAIKQLCRKGIVLKNGQVAFQGSQTEASGYYLATNNNSASFKTADSVEDALGNDNIKILRFEVMPSKGDFLTISSGIDFEVEFFNRKENINLDVTFELRNLDEIALFHHGALLTVMNDSKRGIYTVKGKLPPNFINAGVYRFSLIFGENQRYPLYSVPDITQFEVMNEALGSNSNILPGLLRPQIPYTITFTQYSDGFASNKIAQFA